MQWARSGGAGARKEDGYRRVGAQADPPTDVGGENPGKLVPRFEIQKNFTRNGNKPAGWFKQGEQKPGDVYQRGRKQLGKNYLGSCVIS